MLAGQLPVGTTAGTLNWALCAAQIPESTHRRPKTERRKKRWDTDMGYRPASKELGRLLKIYHARPAVYEAIRARVVGRRPSEQRVGNRRFGETDGAEVDSGRTLPSSVALKVDLRLVEAS